MVLLYLSECKQKLVKEKIDLLSKFQKTQMLIKEKEELKEVIENSKNTNYESFVPSNYKDNINNQHLKDLEEELQGLEDVSRWYQLKIEEVENQLDELEHIIGNVKQEKYAKEELKKQLSINEEFYLQVLENHQYEKNRIMKHIQDTILNDFEEVLNKLEMCTKIIDLDPCRSKLCVQSMSKEVKAIFQNINKTIYNMCPTLKSDVDETNILNIELERLRRDSNKKVSYKITGNSNGIPMLTILNIYDIVNEAYEIIINILELKYMNVYIEYTKNTILIKIKSDKYDTENPKVHNNMSIICGKVYLLSGTISIENNESNTKMNIIIPVKHNRA